MSATRQRPRKHHRDPDAPIPNRSASSIDMVLDSACCAARAWRGGDKAEIRSALAALADEAGMLARMDPLPLPSPVARRQLIAAERERTGRGGSS